MIMHRSVRKHTVKGVFLISAIDNNAVIKWNVIGTSITFDWYNQ